MKKLLLWLLFFSPVWLMGQEIKNGTFSIDFGKKKKAASDSVQQQAINEEEQEDTIPAKPHKEKKHKEATVNNTGSYYD